MSLAYSTAADRNLDVTLANESFPILVGTPDHAPVVPAKQDAVAKATEWLVRHVKRGKLKVGGRDTELSVIAWKDPTLSPEVPDRMADYAITVTLWASYALTLWHPEVAMEWSSSLKTIVCDRNSLHDVVLQPIDSIHHKPVDTDLVHGRSLGLMIVGDTSIDVRSFTQAYDQDFSIGHPTLFAEHAAYQLLFELRAGEVESAKNRQRTIFRAAQEEAKPVICWDSEHQLLVDFVVASQHADFLSGRVNSCRQYSFKVATFFYACRFTGIASELPVETAKLEDVLFSVQRDDGGVPHYYDVNKAKLDLSPCQDATGEASAIFILATTITVSK